ncbi:MAG: HIT domain-containing protein [Candidatus Sericytochromatia bacterium]
MENMDRLFVPSKLKYVKGERPNVKCILCAVVDKDPNVSNLDVYRTKNFIVSANLFPYNPGHLMIFPIRHIETIEDFTDEEALELHHLQLKSLKILRNNYNCQSFNVGYNIGSSSGASIDHLHLHIVPRYPREIGFIDVIGGARILVEDPNDTVSKLRDEFNNKL